MAQRELGQISRRSFIGGTLGAAVVAGVGCGDDGKDSPAGGAEQGGADGTTGTDGTAPGNTGGASNVGTTASSASGVEGISRHASTHAAGVVISREPLTRYVPLQRGGKIDSQEAVMTQFAMGDIALIGLLKMDILGLANLTILGRARDIIREKHGPDIDLLQIPTDDKKTFELLASGETAGVFQLEGAGMRRYIKELKPTTFGDIAAMVALYRPGPMEHIPIFIDAKHGRKPIKYPHPTLENILKDTYGVIVYQDQVLFIVREFAGYTLGQADIFRKAMGRRLPR